MFVRFLVGVLAISAQRGRYHRFNTGTIQAGARLDLATPLTSLEPTATTVFGVVRSVTVVSLFLESILLALQQGRVQHFH